MAFAPTSGGFTGALPGAAAASGSFLSNVGGGLANVWEKIKENPEMATIMLDMLGSRLAPESPFAGVGTAMAKSKLAAGAEAERASEAKSMFEQLLGSITGKDQAGPTDINISADPSGTGGLAYKISGLEGAQKRLEDISGPAIKSAEDFLKDFGGGGGF